jgi:O-methyltransferase domain
MQMPHTDPTPIFEIFRANYATELLTAAVAHFNLFGKLAHQPMTANQLGQSLGLAERPTTVLLTALRAFGLLTMDGAGRLQLTELAREHLLPGAPFDVGDYVGLTANNPGVIEMIERLRTNKPANHATGAAFIYREGVASAMENEAAARHFTLALAGRAKNVAPVLAERVPLDGARLLVDVGGGTGIYSIALLQKNPSLRAIVVDRPEVLKVAAEVAAASGVGARLQTQAGDMFCDSLPIDADVVLMSNILHDWDVAECRTLIAQAAASLRDGGRLLIHDAFLNDALDGPLPIALYSAALFSLTEGRAYSAAEYRGWLIEAGLTPGVVTPTLVHCGVIAGHKKLPAPSTRP